MRPLRFLSAPSAEMEVREEVRQLARPLAEELGFEVVEVEHAVLGRHRVLRILLDKPEGITIADCARFSRRLEDCLDMNQTITGNYQLEVSSPGIDRPLKTLESVARFSGSRAVLVTHDARDGRRNFEGELLGPDASGRVGIRTVEGEEHWFVWTEVRTGRLVADPWKAKKAEQDGRGSPKRHPKWRDAGGAR